MCTEHAGRQGPSLSFNPDRGRPESAATVQDHAYKNIKKDSGSEKGCLSLREGIYGSRLPPLSMRYRSRVCKAAYPVLLATPEGNSDKDFASRKGGFCAALHFHHAQEVTATLVSWPQCTSPATYKRTTSPGTTTSSSPPGDVR
jgi:hypothetical protein